MVHNNKIGVVTVTYNSESVIRDFLESCQKQLECDFILYVVDNNSNDNSLNIIKNSDLGFKYKIIPNKDNFGVAKANNQGIECALEDQCEYILLINNDVVFGEKLFYDLVNGSIKYKASIVVPKMYYYDEPTKIWCAGGKFLGARGNTPYHCGINEIDRGNYDHDCPTQYSPTCCALMQRSIFERIGYMDVKYFVYYDDTDFFFRAYKNQEIVYYLGGAILYHKVSSLTGGGSTPFALKYMTRNRVYFLRKFYKNRFELILWKTHLRIQMIRDYLMGRVDFNGYKIMSKAFSEGEKLDVI